MAMAHGLVLRMQDYAEKLDAKKGIGSFSQTSYVPDEESDESDEVVPIIKSWLMVAKNSKNSKMEFFSLLRQTLLFMLSPNWMNCTKQNDLLYAFRSYHQKFSSMIKNAEAIKNSVIQLSNEPWKNPFFRWGDLTSDKLTVEDKKVQCFFVQEPEEIVLARVQAFVKCGDLEAAFGLAKLSFLYHSRVKQSLAKPVFKENENSTSFSEDNNCEGHASIDWYITLLERKRSLSLIIKESSQLSCHEGVEIMCRLKKKHPRFKSLVLALAQIFIMQDLIKPSKYCCTKKLFELFCHMHKECNSSTKEITESVEKIFAHHAPTSVHLYLIVDAMWEKFGAKFFQLYIEYLVRGLTADINHLETAKNDFPDEVEPIEVHISSIFAKLSTLFRSFSEEANRECLFSAFILKPSKGRVYVLKSLNESIQTKQMETMDSNKFRDCTCSRICNGYCKPSFSDNNFDHPLLKKGIRNVPFSLVEDLVTILESIRSFKFQYNLFDWQKDVPKLLNYLMCYKNSRSCGNDGKEVPRKTSSGDSCKSANETNVLDVSRNSEDSLKSTCEPKLAEITRSSLDGLKSSFELSVSDVAKNRLLSPNALVKRKNSSDNSKSDFLDVGANIEVHCDESASKRLKISPPIKQTQESVMSPIPKLKMNDAIERVIRLSLSDKISSEKMFTPVTTDTSELTQSEEDVFQLSNKIPSEKMFSSASTSFNNIKYSGNVFPDSLDNGHPVQHRTPKPREQQNLTSNTIVETQKQYYSSKQDLHRNYATEVNPFSLKQNFERPSVLMKTDVSLDNKYDIPLEAFKQSLLKSTLLGTDSRDKLKESPSSVDSAFRKENLGNNYERNYMQRGLAKAELHQINQKDKNNDSGALNLSSARHHDNKSSSKVQLQMSHPSLQFPLDLKYKNIMESPGARTSMSNVSGSAFNRSMQASNNVSELTRNRTTLLSNVNESVSNRSLKLHNSNVNASISSRNLQFQQTSKVNELTTDRNVQDSNNVNEFAPIRNSHSDSRANESIAYRSMQVTSSVRELMPNQNMKVSGNIRELAPYQNKQISIMKKGISNKNVLVNSTVSELSTNQNVQVGSKVNELTSKRNMQIGSQMHKLPKSSAVEIKTVDRNSVIQHTMQHLGIRLPSHLTVSINSNTAQQLKNVSQKDGPNLPPFTVKVPNKSIPKNNFLPANLVIPRPSSNTDSVVSSSNLNKQEMITIPGILAPPSVIKQSWDAQSTHSNVELKKIVQTTSTTKKTFCHPYQNQMSKTEWPQEFVSKTEKIKKETTYQIYKTKKIPDNSFSQNWQSSQAATNSQSSSYSNASNSSAIDTHPSKIMYQSNDLISTSEFEKPSLCTYSYKNATSALHLLQSNNSQDFKGNLMNSKPSVQETRVSSVSSINTPANNPLSNNCSQNARNSTYLVKRSLDSPETTPRMFKKNYSSQNPQYSASYKISNNLLKSNTPDSLTVSQNLESPHHYRGLESNLSLPDSASVLLEDDKGIVVFKAANTQATPHNFLKQNNSLANTCCSPLEVNPCQNCSLPTDKVHFNSNRHDVHSNDRNSTNQIKCATSPRNKERLFQKPDEMFQCPPVEDYITCHICSSTCSVTEYQSHMEEYHPFEPMKKNDLCSVSVGMKDLDLFDISSTSFDSLHNNHTKDVSKDIFNVSSVENKEINLPPDQNNLNMCVNLMNNSSFDQVADYLDNVENSMTYSSDHSFKFPEVLQNPLSNTQLELTSNNSSAEFNEIDLENSLIGNNICGNSNNLDEMLEFLNSTSLSTTTQHSDTVTFDKFSPSGTLKNCNDPLDKNKGKLSKIKKNLYCKLCLRKYSSKCTIRKHIRTFHTEIGDNLIAMKGYIGDLINEKMPLETSNPIDSDNMLETPRNKVSFTSYSFEEKPLHVNRNQSEIMSFDPDYQVNQIMEGYDSPRHSVVNSVSTLGSAESNKKQLDSNSRALTLSQKKTKCPSTKCTYCGKLLTTLYMRQHILKKHPNVFVDKNSSINNLSKTDNSSLMPEEFKQSLLETPHLEQENFDSNTCLSISDALKPFEKCEDLSDLVKKPCDSNSNLIGSTNFTLKNENNEHLEESLSSYSNTSTNIYYRCPLCSRNYTSQSFLNKHIKSYHSSDDKNEIPSSGVRYEEIASSFKSEGFEAHQSLEDVPFEKLSEAFCDLNYVGSNQNNNLGNSQHVNNIENNQHIDMDLLRVNSFISNNRSEIHYSSGYNPSNTPTPAYYQTDSVSSKGFEESKFPESSVKSLFPDKYSDQLPSNGCKIKLEPDFPLPSTLNNSVQVEQSIVSDVNSFLDSKVNDSKNSGSFKQLPRFACRVCLKTFCGKAYFKNHYKLKHNTILSDADLNAFKCTLKVNLIKADILRKKQIKESLNKKISKMYKARVKKECNMKEKVKPLSRRSSREEVNVDFSKLNDIFSEKLSSKEIMSCKICNKPYSNRGNLKTHLRNVHNYRGFRERFRKQIKDVQCHICLKVYKTTSLKAHIKMIHGDAFLTENNKAFTVSNAAALSSLNYCKENNQNVFTDCGDGDVKVKKIDSDLSEIAHVSLNVSTFNDLNREFIDASSPRTLKENVNLDSSLSTKEAGLRNSNFARRDSVCSFRSELTGGSIELVHKNGLNDFTSEDELKLKKVNVDMDDLQNDCSLSDIPTSDDECTEYMKNHKVSDWTSENNSLTIENKISTSVEALESNSNEKYLNPTEEKFKLELDNQNTFSNVEIQLENLTTESCIGDEDRTEKALQVDESPEKLLNSPINSTSVDIKNINSPTTCGSVHLVHNPNSNCSANISLSQMTNDCEQANCNVEQKEIEIGLSHLYHGNPAGSSLTEVDSKNCSEELYFEHGQKLVCSKSPVKDLNLDQKNFTECGNLSNVDQCNPIQKLDAVENPDLSNNPSAKESKTNQHECRLCRKMFKTMKLLSKHLKVTHNLPFLKKQKSTKVKQNEIDKSSPPPLLTQHQNYEPSSMENSMEKSSLTNESNFSQISNDLCKYRDNVSMLKGYINKICDNNKFSSVPTNSAKDLEQGIIASCKSEHSKKKLSVSGDVGICTDAVSDDQLSEGKLSDISKDVDDLENENIGDSCKIEFAKRKLSISTDVKELADTAPDEHPFIGCLLDNSKDYPSCSENVDVNCRFGVSETKIPVSSDKQDFPSNISNDSINVDEQCVNNIINASSLPEKSKAPILPCIIKVLKNEQNAIIYQIDKTKGDDASTNLVGRKTNSSHRLKLIMKGKNRNNSLNFHRRLHRRYRSSLYNRQRSSMQKSRTIFVRRNKILKRSRKKRTKSAVLTLKYPTDVIPFLKQHKQPVVLLRRLRDEDFKKYSVDHLKLSPSFADYKKQEKQAIVRLEKCDILKVTHTAHLEPSKIEVSFSPARFIPEDSVNSLSKFKKETLSDVSVVLHKLEVNVTSSCKIPNYVNKLSDNYVQSTKLKECRVVLNKIDF